jgi:hypothetical protein
MASSPTNQVTKYRIIDVPGIPEPFADCFAGLVSNGPIAHLAFATRRPAFDEQPKLNRVVTARVAITLDAAMELHNALSNLFTQMEADGLLSRETTVPKTIQ